MEAWKWLVGIGIVVGGVVLWRRHAHALIGPIPQPPSPTCVPKGTWHDLDSTTVSPSYTDGSGRLWTRQPCEPAGAACGNKVYGALPDSSGKATKLVPFSVMATDNEVACALDFAT